MRRSIFTTCALFGLWTAGCKSDNSLAVVVDRGTGDTLTIEGRVCDPDRGTWLEGAEVYMHLFDGDGTLYQTISDESDADGIYQLVDVPVDGVQPIYIQYGNQVIDQFEVQVPEGSAYVTLPDPECGGTDAALAVVSGDYEDFDTTLQAMGIGNFDIINGQTGDELIQFLTNDTALSAYQAIIFGGGHLEEDVFYDTNGSDVDDKVSLVRAALKAYIQGGGTIIVTDWSYDIVESIWPDQVNFLGDDTVPDDAQRGDAGLVVADVVDADLKATVGNSQVNVDYDLIEFPLVESVDASTTVYLRGDVAWRDGESSYVQSSSPLLVSFTDGSGTVWLSTFRFSANTDTTAKSVVRSLLNGL